MNQLAAIVAVVAMTGCGVQMSSGARTGTIVGGIAIATAGVLVAQPTAVDSDRNGSNDNPLNDDYSSLLPGLLMVAGGLVMTMAGLTATTAKNHEPPIITAPAAPPSVIVTAPPGLVVSVPTTVALPELPVDAATLQLGKQVRSAVAAGHCEHAWLMWQRMNEQDSRYAAAIITGELMAPCRR